MRRAIYAALFVMSMTCWVHGDSLFTQQQPIDMSILPGDPEQREVWLRAVRERFCYPPGDTNCDGRINPVDVVLIINRVYLGYAFPECK